MLGADVLAIEQLVARAESRPSAYLPWLPIQLSFFQDPAKRKLIRCGNQAFGKTEALCAELRWRCTGTHPYLETPPPPIRAIVISPTADHSRKFQRKFWRGLDPRTIASRTRWDPSIGFRGRVQDCWFTSGSVVEFHSAAAGGLSLSGDTLDLVAIDEPTKHRIYSECERRVLIQGGYVIMGMTPINAPEPLDWLKTLVDQGVVSEHHTKMEPDALIPVGHAKPRTTVDGAPMDASWIEEQRRAVLSIEAPIVLDGEWETPPEGQAFPAFDWQLGGQHVTDEWDPSREVDLYVGVDHGERDHKQCGILVAVHGGGVYPQVTILDEYVGEGLTTHEQDAVGILAMLQRWGVRWKDLTAATGDKPHDVHHIRYSVGRKSNSRLQAAIARECNLAPNNLQPPLRQAKKGARNRGRLDYGVHWLHEQMLRPGHFRIQPRCERTIAGLRRWAWKDDEHKDIVDALRYAIEPVIMRSRRLQARTVLRVDG